MNLSRYFKVGAFFITLGIAGGAYVVKSTDGFNSINTKIYEVIIDDATGLSTNSKVYLAGVPVGKIRAIDINGEQALLRVAFLRDVEIRQDAKLARKASSLLGTSILTLTPGSELTPIIQEGERINSVRGTGDMGALVGSASVLSEQISQMLKDFQDRQLELLAVSLETFNSIAIKLDERSDAELARVSRILESSALITEGIERIMREREGDIDSSAQDIRIALDNLRSATEEIRAGQGNIGKAIYDEALYAHLLSTVERTDQAAEKLQLALDNISTLAVNADRVVTDAGQIVSKASGMSVQVDSGVRYDILSSNFNGRASIRLDPSSHDRWYRVGVAGVPDGVTKHSEIKTSENGTVTKTEKTETNYTFAVDAELARSFGPLTLRGGLIESTAGFGLDYQPFNRLSISGELFKFRNGSIPNLRGFLTFYPFFDPYSDKPWNWLYLQGGINAALEEDRDFFIGAGIRFVDEEVRGLIGLVPLSGN